MKVSHTFPMVARCPNHSGTDSYECEVVMDRLMMVEDILEITDGYGLKKIFQEDLAQELANKLRAEVTLRGLHAGVKTVATCQPNK
jgi:hypothetical protein